MAVLRVGRSTARIPEEQLIQLASRNEEATGGKLDRQEIPGFDESLDDQLTDVRFPRRSRDRN